MSTEEKKWTQEELEAFLQEQWERDQERQEQEWEDEYEPSLSDEDEDWADDEVLERKRRQIREEEEQEWDEMLKKITEWRQSYDARNGWKEILQMMREDRIRRYGLLQKAKEETAHIRPLPREHRMWWQMVWEQRDINISLGCIFIEEEKKRVEKKQKLEARVREIDAFIRLLPREHRMWLEGKMDVWDKWSLEERYEEEGFPYDKKMLEAKAKALVESMRILEIRSRSYFLDSIEEELGKRGFEEELDELEQEKSEEWVLCGEQGDYLWRIWLAKEWNRYLETKELMLRKTRSKDVTGVIMSFC